MDKKDNGLPKRKPTRLKEHDYSASQFYLLTTCTHNHKQIFKNDTAAKIAFETIFNTAEKAVTDLMTICIMPDHIHLLLIPKGEYSTNYFMRVLKRKISYLLKRCGFRPPFWQRSYYDHIVRKGENIEKIINYILQNPVRKGLVDSFEEYPWSWDAFKIIETAKKQREG